MGSVLAPLDSWASSSLGQGRWLNQVPPDPHPCPVSPGSGAEPSTANSSPTWKNTGLNRDCGSKTHTRTRPNAVSCSSGPQPPGAEGWPSHHAPPSRAWHLHLAFLSNTSAHLPPGVQLRPSTLAFLSLSVSPCLPVSLFLHPSFPLCPVSMPCLCLCVLCLYL